MKKIVIAAVIAAAILLVCSYKAGFNAAIRAARPYIEGDSILIEFNDQVHEYDFENRNVIRFLESGV